MGMSDPDRPTLAALAADPAMAAGLPPEERSKVLLQCAAILVALASAPPFVEERDLKPDEAAEQLGVSRSTLYEMLRDGLVSHIPKGKRGKLIPASEIASFRKRNLRRGSEPAPGVIRARSGKT